MKRKILKFALFITGLLLLTSCGTDPQPYQHIDDTPHIVTLKPGVPVAIGSPGSLDFFVIKLRVDRSQGYPMNYILYRLPYLEFEEELWWPSGFPMVFDRCSWRLRELFHDGDAITVTVYKFNPAAAERVGE